MIIKATIDGEELEFEVLGGKLGVETTHIISGRGNIELLDVNNNIHAQTHLRLIRKRHSFCGVVFEETGEVRIAHIGEAWLRGDGTVCLESLGRTAEALPILRPVSIEAPDA